MPDNTDIRCVGCGKFIPYTDLIEGQATSKCVQDYAGDERVEFLCKEHSVGVNKDA